MTALQHVHSTHRLLAVPQKYKKLIDDKYRINLVLDNLPVTAQDLLDKVC